LSEVTWNYSRVSQPIIGAVWKEND